MKPQYADRTKDYRNRFRGSATFFCCAALMLVFAACSELEKPKTEEFYSETKPPRTQEFRWTNGQMPKSFDPAKASAPPETDFVRALYEGLTDTEQKTLKPIPAVAAEWSSSDDAKVWTFKLRRDAKWSNGKLVVASDFVRSWERLAEMGEDVPHHELLKNIVGMAKKQNEHNHRDRDVFGEEETPKPLSPNEASAENSIRNAPSPNSNTNVAKGDSVLKNQRRVKEKYKNLPSLKMPDANEKPKLLAKTKGKKSEQVGVEANGDYELKVTLVQPDKDFPNLVAHPVFRPVYANGGEFEKAPLNPDLVTNGAFSLTSVSETGVELMRAEHYWNKDKVKLKKVRFVPTKDADSALKAYRDGEVDAVTNAQFEPLALKLLTPYFDFRRVTHSALNLYEFNRQKAPFNDRRVREALALAIEREKLTQDEMDGATKPAYTYLPFGGDEPKGKFEHDSGRARELLEKAGFANGENFPKIRLVVNRNNVQQQIAKSVAEMWEKELNIDTEIVVKELEELEKAKLEGDFDILRRGIVLPTSDETANMLAIFKPVKLLKEGIENGSIFSKNGERGGDSDARSKRAPNPTDDQKQAPQLNDPVVSITDPGDSGDLVINIGEDHYILTEEEALLEVPGIPLYFPTSYSLVKPYVMGFEMNTLDAPSLQEVRIDSSWQPENPKSES